MVRKGAPREGSEQRTDSSVHRVPLAACRGQKGEVGEKTREKTRLGKQGCGKGVEGLGWGMALLRNPEAMGSPDGLDVGMRERFPG